MRKRWIAFLLFLPGASLPADSKWAAVEKILGRPGVEAGQGFQVLFPRTDLNVLVEGFPLDSANALVSRVTFQPAPEGAAPGGRKKTQVTGQIYLLDSEVPQAMAQAARNGLEMTALYSPFLDSSPALKCLRLRGEGTPSNLAWAAKMVLSATGTPLLAPHPSSTPTALPTPSPRPSAWQDIQDLLGGGEEKGPTLQYDWSGKSREATLIFQTDVTGTAVLGEFAVPPEDSENLMEELLQRHITLTALFTEKTGTGERDIVGFWAVGRGKKLAEGLKEVLDQEGLTDR